MQDSKLVHFAFDVHFLRLPLHTCKPSCFISASSLLSSLRQTQSWLVDARHVVLLLEEVAAHLAVLQQLEVAVAQALAVLEVVDAFALVALAHFFADEAGHHAAHPLLAEDAVLGALEGQCVWLDC